MVNLCRICLNFLTEGSEYFSLNTVVINTGYTPYRDKLSSCIPEISLDAVSDAILCVPCAANLESAYEFRNKCLETEVRIQSFMQERAPGQGHIEFDETFLRYLGFNIVVEETDGEVVENIIKIESESADDDLETSDGIELSNEYQEGDEVILEEPAEEMYEEENEDYETTVQLIECLTCSKKFTSLMHFNVHQLTEHGNTNLHTCTFCRRPFNSNISLERHMKNSHREYTCNVCGEEFDNKVKYNRHLRTMHGISNNVAGFPVKSGRSSMGSSMVRHKRENLPKQAKKIMYKWLLENCQHPYPTDSQKKELVEQTNLTLLQVTNWFINARRRILQPLLEKCGGLIDVEAELPVD